MAKTLIVHPEIVDMTINGTLSTTPDGKTQAILTRFAIEAAQREAQHVLRIDPGAIASLTEQADVLILNFPDSSLNLQPYLREGDEVTLMGAYGNLTIAAAQANLNRWGVEAKIDPTAVLDWTE